MRYRNAIPKSIDPTLLRPSAFSRTPFLLLLTLLLLAGAFSAPLHAQSRKELESKRKQLLKEINLTNNLLKETKKNQEAALSLYVTLQRQIKKRQLLIATLRQEITYTNQRIDQISTIINSLSEDVDRLKIEYAQITRSAFRQKLQNTSLLFLFSAKSFNDAVRRWRYLKQYDRYRKKQARLILETQDMLAEQRKWLEAQRLEQQSLLQSEEEQAGILNQELNEKDNLLKSLKKNEAKLSSELKEKQKAHRELNNAIEKIIREEMAKARRKSREAGTTTGDISATELEAAAASFEKAKGLLGWPVRNGLVTSYFGRQEHPTIAGVMINNNGIDIQTDQKEKVKAVYKGKVVGVQFIPGYNYMVILQHGNFYTVYSNLEEALVKRDQEIQTQQVIGYVSNDRKTNIAELHFEVWLEKTRLNPMEWLRTN